MIIINFSRTTLRSAIVSVGCKNHRPTSLDAPCAASAALMPPATPTRAVVVDEDSDDDDDAWMDDGATTLPDDCDEPAVDVDRGARSATSTTPTRARAL